MSGHRAAEDHNTAYIAAVMKGRQRRSFFMVQNDTHGLAYCGTRPYPEITETTEYVQIKEEKHMANQEMIRIRLKAYDHPVSYTHLTLPTKLEV